MQNKPKQSVIVVMGHIDHGKSSLLDYIRKTNSTAKEAGGITQHLGAYEAEFKNSEGKEFKMTFLDTPGHEAFQLMRGRSASAADIAILVVSAEDGVKPQTLEALKCIRASKIPFVVAINKIDKPEANIEKTKISLSENEVFLEGFGGDVPWVAVSAINGEGVQELLDTLGLITELENYSADTNKDAEGIVIETGMDKKKGVYATLVVKSGTLKSGTFILAQKSLAPVRILEDMNAKPIKEALPGKAVRVTGFDTLPSPGDDFKSYKNKKDAEKIKEENIQSELKIKRVSKLAENDQLSKDKSDDKDKKKIIVLPVILKADTFGSLEGVKYEISKIKEENVKIKIVSEGLGNISENDIKMVLGSPECKIIGFNISLAKEASDLAERNNIKIEIFNIIYKLIEFLQKTISENRPKEYIEEIQGILKILQVFSRNKNKSIAGGKVQSGSIKLGSEVKIMRRDVEIAKGKIRELQQNKSKASEVSEGSECGILIESTIEIAPGDKLQSFKIIEKIL